MTAANRKFGLHQSGIRQIAVRVAALRVTAYPFGAALLLALLSMLCTLGMAHAQTSTYYADDVQTKPVQAKVSPGFLTLLEFYQDVDQISSGRPDLLHVETAGAKVYITALGRSGSTDLVIEVGARTQMVNVQVVPGNTTRRYVVLLDKPAKVAVKAPPLGAGPALAKQTPAKPAQASQAPPKTAAASKPLLRQATRRSMAAGANLNPAWLSFRVIEQNLSRKAGEVTLFFAVQHNGKAPLMVLDGSALEARQGGVRVPVKVLQGANPGVLRSGQTQTGTLVLRLGAGVRRSGPISLSWTVRDPAASASYRLERRLGHLPL